MMHSRSPLSGWHWGRRDLEDALDDEQNIKLEMRQITQIHVRVKVPDYGWLVRPRNA